MGTLSVCSCHLIKQKPVVWQQAGLSHVAVIWSPFCARAHTAWQLLPSVRPGCPLTPSSVPFQPQPGFGEWGGSPCSSIVLGLEGTCCTLSTSFPTRHCHSSPSRVMGAMCSYHLSCSMCFSRKVESCHLFLFGFHADFAQVGNNSRKSPKAVTQRKISTCGHD